MREPQPDDHPHIQDLHTWATKVQQLGIDDTGLEINRPFIADQDVEAYFKDIRTTRKLLAALFRDDNHEVDAETIQKKYPKVFLTLLLTGNGRFITSFVQYDCLCDQYLPFRVRPPNFPSSSHGDFFPSFCRQQWQFCARVFQYGVHQQFDANDVILPITSKEKLGGGGSATVYKIILHAEYDKLGCESPSQDSPTDEDLHAYVLKTYNTPDAENNYKNEVSGFRNCRGSNVNIIGFHGSFIWRGTYNVLLEYADKGTLEQYFNTTNSPTNGEDITKFYRELFKTLPALFAIHSVQQSDPAATSILQGWHQDIKPSNILVKSKKGGSFYDCDFKLADLGLSHFKKHVSSQGDATDRDSHGTRAYGAPECYRADGDTERIRFPVPQVVDIWSLGCVFSEAAVWLVYGKDFLPEYRRRRGNETAKIYGFRDGDCFHNGYEVLTTVTQIHKDLTDDIRLCDHVTRATLEMVAKEMLRDADYRSSAKCLIGRTKDMLRDAETKLESHAGSCSVSGFIVQSPPRTPPEPPPGHLRSRTDNSRSQHLLSYGQAGSPAGTSEDEHEAHNQRYADDFIGKRASTQARYSDRSTRSQNTGLVDHDQFSKNNLNRAFSAVRLAEASTADSYWQEPQSPNSRRHRTSSHLLSGTNTSNGTENRQEAYSVNQYHAFTASPEGVSRRSTATLVQDPHHGSGTGRHHSRIDSGVRSARSRAIGPSNVHPPTEPQTRPDPHFLSVTEAQRWKSDKKEHRPAKKLPGDHLLADLDQRDHVFLIDNSLSMAPHCREVRDLFGLLGYIVKSKDPDGIELHFTMSRDRKDKAKHTGQLLRTLDSVRYCGTSNIRLQLADILQNYHTKLRDQNSPRSLFNIIKPRRPARPQTVYIFTDGVWQPDCDPAPMIKKLVDSLDQNSMEREQFGIQFIRFGNDPDGFTRLNQLDSGLGLTMDIVDTEPSDGNVWKMLYGAVNRWYDDDNTNFNGSTVVSPVTEPL